jgi:hypothetical protein
LSPARNTERVEHRDLHRVIGWFISIRWVATGSVPLTLVVAQRVFQTSLVYRDLYAAAIALGLVNLVYTMLYWRTAQKNWTESRYSRLFNAQILAAYRAHMIPRAAGRCATLSISAYLITSIRSRIEEKGRAAEFLGGELRYTQSLDTAQDLTFTFA